MLFAKATSWDKRLVVLENMKILGLIQRKCYYLTGSEQIQRKSQCQCSGNASPRWPCVIFMKVVLHTQDYQ